MHTIRLKTALVLFSLLFSGLSISGKPTLTLDNAVSELRRDFPGRVIAAETVKRDKKELHQIRILTDDGKVKRFKVDPRKTYKAQRQNLSRPRQ